MTHKIQLTIALTPRLALYLLTMALVAAAAVELGSETLVMTTTYPSPAGIYARLITTGGTSQNPVATLLSRDHGTVAIGSNQSSITLQGNPTLLQVGGGGSGKLSIYSTDASWGQLQIGNPNTGEASISFINGVNNGSGSGFGDSAGYKSAGTSWDVGVGNCGNGSNFGFVTGNANGNCSKVLSITPSGGLVFSDGTTQTTAAAGSSPVTCTWTTSALVTATDYWAAAYCPSGYLIDVECNEYLASGSVTPAKLESVLSDLWGGAQRGFCGWDAAATANRNYQASVLCCTGLTVTNTPGFYGE
jgi:hypothetical protein